MGMKKKPPRPEVVDGKIRAQIFEEIETERKRQDDKFGPRNGHSPERWLVILAEEFGEVSKAIIEKDLANYYEELVQTAAVCVAALESLCLSLSDETHDESEGS